MAKYKSKHGYEGLLIVIEGTDGSGKSTQIGKLKRWIEDQSYGAMVSEWKTSKFIADAINDAKDRNLLNATTFSLLYAADFADRLEQVIIPALKAGFIVLADRYVYTAFARDVARGVDRNWVRKVYGFAVKPDLTMYFRVSEDVSLERICSNRAPKFYEAGMDLKISNDPYESYKIFQKRVNDEYKSMIDEYGLVEIDANESIHKKQVFFREKVKEVLSQKGIIL